MSEAIYLHDPDSNGVELYRDRPKEDWPRAEDGSFTMFTKPLDVDALLAELGLALRVLQVVLALLRLGERELPRADLCS